jgi:hypothetical protein
MGNFYVNHTVRAHDVAAVADVLRASGRKAWLAPPLDGQIVVYDEASDTQDTTALASLAQTLSRKLQAPCLAVLNHDDDVLMYELHEAGQCIETFSSNPGFTGHVMVGSRGARLCAAWGVPKMAFTVAALLRRKFTFAIDLHTELAMAVGLPPHSIGTGFKYIQEGELPEPLAPGSLLRIP